jgi:predicted DNA-binding protein YlxM (UPF0122 family)
MIEPKLSIDDLKLAAELLKEGVHIEEVADKFDVTTGSLYSSLRKNNLSVRDVTKTLDGMSKMTISELRMIGLEDIPSEPTVVMVKRKPTHVLMTLDTYRELARGT